MNEPPPPDKLMLRLYGLGKPMVDKLRTTKESPSEYIRRLIANDLGVPVPIAEPYPAKQARQARE
jgi:hypothetical protein